MPALRWLEKYRPHKLPFRRHVTRASVALIYRGANIREGELFFIQRARREGDPWSGDMAFPGGRLERSDTSSRHTAMRETLEETGLDLFQQGEYQSRLSDLPHGGDAPCVCLAGRPRHVTQSRSTTRNLDSPGVSGQPGTPIHAADTYATGKNDIPLLPLSGLLYLGAELQHAAGVSAQARGRVGKWRWRERRDTGSP